jgi:hypothetical protein
VALQAGEMSGAGSGELAAADGSSQLQIKDLDMKNERPDGQTLRDILEATLERSLAGDKARASSPSTGSPVVVGEVLDTHHPHLPSRVYVRWFASADDEQRAWLHHERHLELRRGDRVLVTLPLGWAEWVVTGALNRPPGATDAAGDEAGAPAPATGRALAPAAAGAREAMLLRLEPGRVLLIVGNDGEPLIRVHQGPEGPILELCRDQVELKAGRRLRLSAGTIEIAAGQGGVDIRTEGEAVLRAHSIRLN